MIDRKFILENAPNNIGQQLHVNHTNCSFGQDTKRRLYIKRTQTGLIAYCHHCGESGYATDLENRLSGWLFKTNARTKVNAKPNVTELSIEGKIWLCKYYCDPAHKNFDGIVGEQNKVALSLYDCENNLTGLQIRNLTKGAIPKYLTYYYSTSNTGDAAWFYNQNKTLVITEDYLSAYRINKDTKFSSVALLRTTLSDKTLREIYDLAFTHVFIWLDPDEAGNIGAEKTYKKLTYFLSKDVCIAILNFNKEPKECSPKELLKLLED